MDGHTHTADETAKAVARKRGRPQKSKPNDKCTDSEVCGQERRLENSNTKGSGQLDSAADETSKAVAHKRGRPRKIKPNDKCTDSEVCGQERRQENSNTKGSGQLDSAADETSKAVARKRGRPPKNKPNDKCTDSEACGQERRQENSNIKGSGQLDSAADIVKARSRPIVCALAAPTNPLACWRGCQLKNKPKDECGGTSGQAKTSQENNTINIEERGQANSTEEFAKAFKRPIVCALAAPGHQLAHRAGHPRKTKQKDECTEVEVSVPEHIGIHDKLKGQLDSADVIAKACPQGRPRKTRQARRGVTITKEGWLNSTTFGYYFEHIWNSFPEEKLRPMAYFDPLMFYSYKNGYSNIIDVIKKERMLSKKYVLVPIVLWSHWNLLIFCNLGESLNSKTNTPCMLLLDSLHAIGSTSQLEPIIRRLLNDIYESEERHETKEQLKKMPLLVPKVPQQTNGSDCGFYVLYFINLFLNNAPETFSTFNGYPYFMKQDWFSAEEVESFRQTLDALPPDPNDAVSYSSEDSGNAIESLGTKKDGTKFP